MVLAIKIRDNIFIPQAIIDSGKHLLGLHFTVAQNNIKGLFTGNDESLFNDFFNKILKVFEPDLVFGLYHLVDSLNISELLIANNLHNQNVIATNPQPRPEMFLPIENYLNYLGFEIKNPPNLLQLGVLVALKSENIISEFWLEGETRQIKSSQDVDKKDVFEDDVIIGIGSNFVQNEFNPLQQLLPAGEAILENDILKNLDFEKHENRGSGATIILIESDATGDLTVIDDKVNIEHLKKLNAFDSFGEMSKGGHPHQFQTLITLYGDSTGDVKGLAPNANLVVCSLRNIEGFKPKDFINRKNDLLSRLRQNLFNTIKKDRNNALNTPEQGRKNAILLLEFETLIPLGPLFQIESEYFPSYIIYDVYKRLKEITNQQNTIVVGGVGNSSKDFNDLDPFPWKLTLKVKSKLKLLLKDKGYTYIDLTQKDLPFIMVAAVEKNENNSDFTITKESNYGKEMDVYMYTNFNVGRNVDTFKGTSGASAATAGIIAFLQGRALSGFVGNSDLPSPTLPKRRKLTIQIIKRVFERTFMKTFPRDIQTLITHKTTGLINKTTLEELWIECDKELKSLPSQHQ